MKQKIRTLTPPEAALTFCNTQAPMVTVIAIRYRGSLSADSVEVSLQKLQERHLLLRAGISEGKEGYFFETGDPAPPIEVEQVSREGDETCKTEVERALNTTFDTSGTLMRVVHITPPGAGHRGELLLVFHHALIDGISARLLLLDFLRLTGGQRLRVLSQEEKTLGHVYPRSYVRGWKRARFMARQMAEEVGFLLKGGRHRIPAHSRNATISLRFEVNETQKITEAAGKEGLTLNSLIGAAMVHALADLKPAALMRAIAFADLRPRMLPPVSPHELGCYFSMARFSLRIVPHQTVSDTAKRLWEHMYAAGKSGDLFMYSLMAEKVLRMTWRFKRMRMADTALSYIGTLEADRHYGDIEIEDIGAYITNNRFGPVLTAFGMCLLGRLGIDINYLTAELDADTAAGLVAKIKSHLLAYAS